MMTCDHTEYFQDRTEEYNDWTGETETKCFTNERTAFQDIDLHRYQCRLCREVRYYSDRAAEAYKTGVPDPDILITTTTLCSKKA